MTVQASAPVLRSTLNLIHRWLHYQVYLDQLPGLSVAIALGDETVFHEQYGYANLEEKRRLAPDTLFRIASHSKLFTATAIMCLRTEGRVRLDDRVRDHLDWFHSENDPQIAEITIRHLLTHSSGLVRDGNRPHWTYDQAFPDRDILVRQMQEEPAVYDEGLHWKYSNIGYTLLGEIVAAVTGKPYAEAVTDLVLQPLGLKNTFPEFSEDLHDRHATGYGGRLPGEDRQPLEHLSTGAMIGATGFSSTAGDLVAFYQAHRFGNERLLDDSARREMQRVQFQDGEYEWGLGFRLPEAGEVRYAGHGGRFPGFITFSGLNQERDLTIAVLTNAVDGAAQELFEGISKLVCLPLDQPERFEPEGDSPIEEIDSAAGFYRSIWGTGCYGRIGSKLVGIDPGLKDPASELDVYERTGPLTFRIPVRNQFAAIGEDFRFIPDAKGRITRVRYPASTAARWEIPA